MVTVTEHGSVCKSRFGTRTKKRVCEHSACVYVEGVNSSKHNVRLRASRLIVVAVVARLTGSGELHGHFWLRAANGLALSPA